VTLVFPGGLSGCGQLAVVLVRKRTVFRATRVKRSRAPTLLLGFLVCAANADASTIEAEVLAIATERLMGDIGREPAMGEWPDSLRGRYLARVPRDPWDNTYRLLACNLAKNHCRVYSVGVNGLDEGGKGDDVSSWRGYDEDIYFPTARRNRLITFGLITFVVCGIVYKLIDGRRLR
jgi:hypothetical protein